MSTTQNSQLIETLESRTMMSASALSISESAVSSGLQLRVNGTAGNDQITVKQTAAGLVIANGTWSTTVTDKLNSLVINGNAGNNTITVDASVTLNATIIGGGVSDKLVAGAGQTTLFAGTGKSMLQAGAGNDTLVSFGAAAATLIGGAGMDSFWTDNTPAQKVQNVSAAEMNVGAVHHVGSYVNIATAALSKKVAATRIAAAAASSIKEPTIEAGASYANFSNDPIFASTGPSMDDVFQGNSGDCYYLSVLASAAKVDAARITSNILDMGDGTVVVSMNKNGRQVFVREDEMLPVTSSGALVYGGLGQQNCTWVGLMEKAFTYVRTNQASYASIDSGWMDEAYQTLGANPSSTYTADNAAALAGLIAKDVSAGMSVTYATGNVTALSTLVADHAYTVVSVNMDTHGNVSGITLRNPWGCDANGAGNGYITLTAAQAFTSLTGMTAARV